jgi:hypothetical protein
VTNWNFEEVSLSGFSTSTTTDGLSAFVWTVLNRVFVRGLVYLNIPLSLAPVPLPHRVPRVVLRVLPMVHLVLDSPIRPVLKAPMESTHPADVPTALLEFLSLALLRTTSLLLREGSHRVLRAPFLAPRVLSSVLRVQ